MLSVQNGRKVERGKLDVVEKLNVNVICWTDRPEL